jgi:hypothetical protein
MATDEQAAPPLWHEGQAWSAESAKAKLAELDADPEYRKSYLAGDRDKVLERTAFREMAKGRQYGPTPAPADAASVTAQMDARADAKSEKVFDAFERVVIGMSSERRAQYVRNLVTQDQHDAAVMRREQLLRDPRLWSTRTCS